MLIFEKTVTVTNTTTFIAVLFFITGIIMLVVCARGTIRVSTKSKQKTNKLQIKRNQNSGHYTDVDRSSMFLPVYASLKKSNTSTIALDQTDKVQTPQYEAIDYQYEIPSDEDEDDIYASIEDYDGDTNSYLNLGDIVHNGDNKHNREQNTRFKRGPSLPPRNTNEKLIKSDDDKISGGFSDEYLILSKNI